MSLTPLRLSQTKPSGGSAWGKPELVCVDPRRIDEVWPPVRHFIQEALKRGDMGRFDHIEADVLAGDALLWLVWCKPYIEAAVVTQIVQTEKSRVCMIQACGGSRMGRWLDLIGQIEAYAKTEGCRCVRILGRRGWARVLKNYRETKIVLERQI